MARRNCLLKGASTALLSATTAGFSDCRCKAKGKGSPSAAPVAPVAPLDLLRIYMRRGRLGLNGPLARRRHSVSRTRAARGEYENKGGKGGTVGLADFVERYSKDPAALLIGGMVMLGAIALSHPKTTLANVVPVARLTSDYMVIVVPAASKFKEVKDLAADMRSHLQSVVFTGGSVGGVEALRRSVLHATDSPAWRRSLVDNNWISAVIHGKEFANVLEVEQAIAGAVSMMLKLKA